ncbi:SinR family protein [Sphingobacterium sp. UT-1RO-CII-1]|uniref:SinR family protein n=1 Tax=Sphingobacterium sp. UT-1RO-CII-1 TaxID=2995225 RepID=UPI00227C365F|nr:SinR family protein [Sphingobacterium sp. UT-1RO-CII-1]MCY4780355.1 SinR family protein [Sphingobacterium sp. UT-1RO-CII-1]
MKKSYLIGYDLNKTGQDYTTLIEEIKRLGTWWHCLDSTFIVKSSSPATLIRDHLKKFIDSNDELLVVCLSGEGAWAGFSNECSDWLKNNL